MKPATLMLALTLSASAAAAQDMSLLGLPSSAPTTFPSLPANGWAVASIGDEPILHRDFVPGRHTMDFINNLTVKWQDRPFERPTNRAYDKGICSGMSRLVQLAFVGLSQGQGHPTEAALGACLFPQDGLPPLGHPDRELRAYCESHLQRRSKAARTAAILQLEVEHPAAVSGETGDSMFRALQRQISERGTALVAFSWVNDKSTATASHMVLAYAMYSGRAVPPTGGPARDVVVIPLWDPNVRHATSPMIDRDMARREALIYDIQARTFQFSTDYLARNNAGCSKSKEGHVQPGATLEVGRDIWISRLTPEEIAQHLQHAKSRQLDVWTDVRERAFTALP